VVAFHRAIAEGSGTGRWSTIPRWRTTVFLQAQEAFGASPPRERAAVLYLSKALDHCDQALKLADNPSVVAFALDLKASILWWRGWRMWDGQPEAQTREFRLAGKFARKASRRGWWMVCRAELGLADSPASVQLERQQPDSWAADIFRTSPSLQSKSFGRSSC